MSYILEALKKSERERQRASAQVAVTPQDEPAVMHSARQWNGLRTVLIVNALLVVAVLGYFLLSQQRTETGMTAAEGVTALQSGHVVAESLPPDSSPEDEPRGGGPGREEGSAPGIRAEPQPDPAAGSSREKQAPPQREPEPQQARPKAPTEVVTLPPETSLTPPIEPVPTEASPVADEKARTMPTPAPAQTPKPRLPYWYETSAALRAAVAQPHIDVHVYAEQPEQRILLIEMRRYREGEMLQNGLRLERITQNGAEFSWQGEQFQVNRQ